MKKERKRISAFLHLDGLEVWEKIIGNKSQLLNDLLIFAFEESKNPNSVYYTYFNDSVDIENVKKQLKIQLEKEKNKEIEELKSIITQLQNEKNETIHKLKNIEEITKGFKNIEMIEKVSKINDSKEEKTQSNTNQTLQDITNINNHLDEIEDNLDTIIDESELDEWSV